jgi:hypothetical protein
MTQVIFPKFPYSYHDFLNVVPAIPFSIRIIENGSVIGVDDGSGNLFGSKCSGSINYITGQILLNILYFNNILPFTSNNTHIEYNVDFLNMLNLNIIHNVLF